MYLLYLKIKVFFYDLIHQFWVKKNLYQDFRFAQLDQAIVRSCNPYKIQEAFPYGETPLWTLKQIGEICGLNREDYVMDLGCGRGRGVFFLAHYFGCRVMGIDQIADFVNNAKNIASQFKRGEVEFYQADLQDFDFSKATCIFLYGTGFEEHVIQRLAAALSCLPLKSKIISVSYPIGNFQVFHTAVLSFPWGKANVFFQYR